MNSFLDQDLYTFTVGRGVLEFPTLPIARYKFYDRGGFIHNDNFFRRFEQKVKEICAIRITKDEQGYLRRACPYLTEAYIDWLGGYKFDREELFFGLDDNNRLSLTIEGEWERTIMWEVPLLAAISEAYYETIDTDWNYDNLVESVLSKSDFIEHYQLPTADMGTRRRRNFHTQDEVVGIFATQNNPYFIGTSNVALAMKYGVKPIGTMSHQWPMGLSALFGHEQAYTMMLALWTSFYGNEQSIVLPDTFGTQDFLKSFGHPYVRDFNGIRHDSGDPFKFTDLVVNHYEKFDVNPKDKIIVYSDKLNVEMAKEIKDYVAGRIKTVFGIGTNLSNDFPNSPALNMVIKLDAINGKAVAKLSDEPDGKSTGNPRAIREAKEAHAVYS